MDGCAGGGEGIQNQYIRLHVAGATESTTIRCVCVCACVHACVTVRRFRSIFVSYRNDFTCYHCGTTLVEDVAYRTLAGELV